MALYIDSSLKSKLKLYIVEKKKAKILSYLEDMWTINYLCLDRFAVKKQRENVQLIN